MDLCHAVRTAPRFAATPLSLRLHLAFAALAAAAMAGPVRANPQGGNVVAGQASIVQPSPALTQINQSSPRAVIDWRSFSIGVGEAVRFNQPSGSAATLNRVVGNDPSSILGSLSANGRVYLVNQNGVFIGRDAQVDAAALVLSTANISNSDFMAGWLNFNQPGKPGARIVNEGRITAADGGLVAMVAPGVENRGVISAKLGQVILAGAPAFSLDLFGDGLVNIVLNQAGMGQIADATGKPLANYVDHSGRVVAEGGRIWISAATARGLVDGMVNISGELRATRVAQQGGEITLLGGNELNISASVMATGSDGKGGSIGASADKIVLASNAVLDASGQAGGGSVLVGGGYQGKAPVPGASTTASSLNVASGASIKADATGSIGNGGLVVLWSENDTRFVGSVSARAGAAGGDGGLMEVSGKKHLAFEGQADASAPKGAAGTLLLDPGSLLVASLGFGGFTAGGGLSSIVAAGTINSVLRTGTTVNLRADDDIRIESQIDGRPALGSLFALPGGGLNLAAGGAVTVNAPVVLNNGAFSSSSGSFSQAEGNVIVTGDKPISISATNAVATQYLLTTGSVNLASSAGNVTAGQTLGGQAPDGSVRPLSSLSVAAPSGTATLLAGLQTSGDTTLNARRVQLGDASIGGSLGVAASEGFVLLGSAKVGAFRAGQQGAPLGSFTIAGNGFSSIPRLDAGAGGVAIVAQTLGDMDYIRSAGPIAIESMAGDVQLARLESSTASAVTVISAGSIDLPKGATVFSNGGDVTLLAAGGNIKLDDTVAANASDASTSSQAGKVFLTANGDIKARQLVALDRVQIKSTTGSVTLQESLGGDKVDRPLVGRLDIEAGKDIVTNGLNLVGTTGGGNGLRLEAGMTGSGQIVVNDRIGVSSGHLLFGPPAPTDNAEYNATHGATLLQGVYARTGGQNITFNVPVTVDGARINQGWQALLGVNANPATNFLVSDELNAKLLDMVLIPLSEGSAATLARNGGALRVAFDKNQGDKGRLLFICPINAGCGSSTTEYWMVPKIVVSNQENPSVGDAGRISFQAVDFAMSNGEAGTAANTAMKIIVPMSASESRVVSRSGATTGPTNVTNYFRQFEVNIIAGGFVPPFNYGLVRSDNRANIAQLDLRFPSILSPQVALINSALDFTFFDALARVSESTGPRKSLTTPIDQNTAAAIELVLYPGVLGRGDRVITIDGYGRTPSGTFGYNSNSIPAGFLVPTIGGGTGLSLSEQIAGAPALSGTSQAAIPGDTIAALAASERGIFQRPEAPCPSRETVVMGRSAGDEVDVGALPALRGAPRSVFYTTYALGEVSAQLPIADEAAIAGARRTVVCP